MTLHTLYRFYDRAGGLLYVGITNNPPRRFGKHKDEKEWWRHVARIALEHHPTREALAAAERAAIETEGPLHNIRMRPAVAEIVWRCDVCDHPIDDGDGYITVSYPDIFRYQRDVDAWKAAHPQKLIRLSEYDTYPEPAKWHVLHRDCDGDIDRYDYWWAIERFRTHQDVIARTAHISTKKWLQHTDWREILYRSIA